MQRKGTFFLNHSENEDAACTHVGTVSDSVAIAWSATKFEVLVVNNWGLCIFFSKHIQYVINHPSELGRAGQQHV